MFPTCSEEPGAVWKAAAVFNLLFAVKMINFACAGKAGAGEVRGT